jgi:hypothetical protein
MAKKIGVLEVDQPLSAEPRVFVSKCVAKYLVRRSMAVRIGPMLIKKLRQAVLKIEQIKERMMGFSDGPLGVGNALPFAKQSDGKPLHYAIPALCDHRLRWMNRFMAQPNLEAC